jgi:hypothetical protein
MKLIVIFGLIICSVYLPGQAQNPFYQDTITNVSEKCNDEIKKAEIDFMNQRFVIALTRPIPFTDTQQKILLVNYGIYTVYKDGIMSPNHDCYNFYLKTLAKQKWGHDIFKKSKWIADSLNSSGLGDQEANFKGKGDFRDYLLENLSAPLKRKLRDIKDTKTIYVKVDISEDGHTDNIRIINSLHLGDIELEVLKFVEGKELWIPKRDDGRGIKTWIIYSIDIEGI